MALPADHDRTRIDRALALVLNGKSYGEAATAVGVGSHSVMAWCKKAGIHSTHRNGERGDTECFERADAVIDILRADLASRGSGDPTAAYYESSMANVGPPPARPAPPLPEHVCGTCGHAAAHETLRVWRDGRGVDRTQLRCLSRKKTVSAPGRCDRLRLACGLVEILHEEPVDAPPPTIPVSTPRPARPAPPAAPPPPPPSPRLPDTINARQDVSWPYEEPTPSPQLTPAEEEPMSTKSADTAAAHATYTDEQLTRFGELVLDQGWKQADAAREVGIHPTSACYYFKRAKRLRGEVAAPKQPTSTPPQATSAPSLLTPADHLHAAAGHLRALDLTTFLRQPDPVQSAIKTLLEAHPA